MPLQSCRLRKADNETVDVNYYSFQKYTIIIQYLKILDT